MAAATSQQRWRNEEEQERPAASLVQMMPQQQESKKQAKPLARWVRIIAFVATFLLIIPDMIFNFNVYTNGTFNVGNLDNAFLNAIAFLVSGGLVMLNLALVVLIGYYGSRGMHWRQIGCWIALTALTIYTIWNSLAFRSEHYVAYNTDKWFWNVFPSAQSLGVSVTEIGVSVFPILIALFLPVIIPPEDGVKVESNEAHQTRLLKLERDADLKTARATANARIREAQVRGAAATATVAREQAGNVLFSKRVQQQEPARVATALVNRNDDDDVEISAYDHVPPITNPHQPVVNPAASYDHLNSFVQELHTTETQPEHKAITPEMLATGMMQRGSSASSATHPTPASAKKTTPVAGAVRKAAQTHQGSDLDQLATGGRRQLSASATSSAPKSRKRAASVSNPV